MLRDPNDVWSRRPYLVTSPKDWYNHRDERLEEMSGSFMELSTGVHQLRRGDREGG